MKSIIFYVAALWVLGISGCKQGKTSAEAEKESGHQHAEGESHADEGHGGKEGHEGEGEQGEHAEEVTLTAEAIRAAQIQTAKTEARGIVSGLSLPARIAFPQQGVARVAARVPGRLAGLEVQLGQTIQKGAVLGYVESPELGQARADYLSAATKARVAQGNFEREKALLEKGITSEREMREAESAFVTAQAERNAAEARLHTLGLSDPEIAALRQDSHYSSRFPLRTPIAGTVVEILGTPGQTVEAATPLFTVGDLSRLWALLDAPESQVAKLRLGQQVELSVTGLPERHFTGQVEYIADIVEEKSRTVSVRVAVPNEDRSLKPGMFATAQVAISHPGDAGGRQQARVVVPREAIQTLGAEQVVFVPEGDNRFTAVPVQVGTTTSTEAEIISGLEPGAEIVTRGAFILKSELSKESMGEGHAH